MHPLMWETIYRVLMMLAGTIKKCYLDSKPEEEARPPPRPLDSTR
jgi:hypothetical protein